MAESEKISVYNLAGTPRPSLSSPTQLTPSPDLKNTSDDALPNYLNSLKFKQSHRLADVRLALGYSAFFLAAACFAWDYKLGHERTKLATAAAVALYVVLNAAMTGWMSFVERGVVYEGVAPSGETVRPPLLLPILHRAPFFWGGGGGREGVS